MIETHTLRQVADVDDVSPLVPSASAAPGGTVPASDSEATGPELFRSAVASLTSTRVRREVHVEPLRPPQRLAPWSYAISADVRDGAGEELATGRLVLLHDPDGVEAWDGELRLVAFASAELDPQMGVDPMLPAVGWSWLTGALEDREAAFRAAGGTVTQTTSTRFGDLAGPQTTIELELRASWTADDADLSAHLNAFIDLLCLAAGLPPEGVTILNPAEVGPTEPGAASAATAPEDAAPADVAPELPLLAEPADGVPEPLTQSGELAAVVEAMRHASGPIALDAERASGYRYSQRAYLVQLRRAGIGTVLIDPIALPALSHLNDAIGPAEWILHAANQDLACLAEVGLHPTELFDTELAGRLLGFERVALGTMVEQYLGVRLEKGHSAADWSTRPLPHDWLVYAALDVELLISLRDVLADQLRRDGKDEWARQEFEAVRTAPAPPPRVDPWRRTSGIHKLRNRRQLAYVRALWSARDEYAARHDIAPGRVLRDQAIIDAARLGPTQPGELAAVSGFNGPRQRRHVERWMRAIAVARELPDGDLPASTGPAGDGIPPASRWADRQPDALERLTRCRAVITEVAETYTVLAQNLLASDVLRRLVWEPPQPCDQVAVTERLAELGARPWQIELTAAGLAEALSWQPED